jgi:hypothetical protein
VKAPQKFVCTHNFAAQCTTDIAQVNGKWVPARPINANGLKERFKLAWMVFTGKADALEWVDQ